LLTSVLGLGVASGIAAIVRRDYFGAPMAAVLGLCVAGGWLLIAPTAYRRKAERRRKATGALYASAAVLEGVERLRATSAFRASLVELRWPWWTWSGYRAGDLLSGVLWVVSDELGSELGWEPSWVGRRCRAKPWWIDMSDVTSADLSGGTLLLHLEDGTGVSFATDREGLQAALERTSLHLTIG
jgi:hypothetical protein